MVAFTHECKPSQTFSLILIGRIKTWIIAWNITSRHTLSWIHHSFIGTNETKEKDNVINWFFEQNILVSLDSFSGRQIWKLEGIKRINTQRCSTTRPRKQCEFCIYLDKLFDQSGLSEWFNWSRGSGGKSGQGGQSGWYPLINCTVFMP